MNSTQPTTANPAITLWITVFLQRFPECMKQLKQRGPEGCAQLTAQEADAAVAEFTKRFGEQS